MREQGNSAWGLTVSRKFETDAQARSAAESLRTAGFREEEIRIWQQRSPAAFSQEDTLARTFEGLMAGGVIGGLAGFFLTAAITWASSERVDMELPAIAALMAAVAGGIVTAMAVVVLSRRIRFQRHAHEAHHEPGTVVTVTVGDREAEARRVFDSVGS